MTGMVVERILSAAWALGGIVVFMIFAVRRSRRLASSATLACPRCPYGLAGLRAPRCPECGFELSAANMIERAMSSAELRAVLWTVLEVGAMGFFAFWAARDLLEVNRLAKIGPFAFFPGYSLLDSTMNPADLTIIAGVCAVLVFAAARVVRQCRCGLRDYGEDAARIAFDYERRLATTAGQASAIEG